LAARLRRRVGYVAPEFFRADAAQATDADGPDVPISTISTSSTPTVALTRPLLSDAFGGPN
jgi:hypothetical protein